jgi:hypothetical protein
VANVLSNVLAYESVHGTDDEGEDGPVGVPAVEKDGRKEGRKEGRRKGLAVKGMKEGRKERGKSEGKGADGRTEDLKTVRDHRKYVTANERADAPPPRPPSSLFCPL